MTSILDPSSAGVNTTPEPECNGICVMGYELIEYASGVAYPHPDCEKHGNPGGPR